MTLYSNRTIATSGAGVYVGGLTQNNTAPGPQGTASVESLIRLYEARGTELWTRQFGSIGGRCLPCDRPDISH